MTSTIIYEGSLRTKATHVQSGNEIYTDAPKDNQGNGEAFSPTDLVATALGSCMMTIMGIYARNHDLNIDGTTLQVTKIMAENPRRIGGIKIIVLFQNADKLSVEKRKALENAARNCPVAKSLHVDIVQDIQFNYQ